MKLQNYILGKWVEGDGDGMPLLNAFNGELITYATTEGLDKEKILDYARKVGGPKLRKMTFQERGRMLKELALYLHERKNNYYPISAKTGSTKVDNFFDIDGGIGTLFAYASLRRQFPDLPYYVDGDAASLSKDNSFIGHHILTPKLGVAIHINAYNFPIWGMLEKLSVNLLAGVPAVVKPATLTSFLTEAMVKDIIDSKILPEGALQLICGSAGDILDYVTPQDVVTFTGSAKTGKELKAHPKIIDNAVPFNMEADSLNASVLGTDIKPDDPEFEIFVKEVYKEMIVKAGQKCTAIRRIIVPENLVEDVQIALGQRIAQTIIGDPNLKEVRMGSLAGLEQRKEVLRNIDLLKSEQEIIIGNPAEVELMGADKEKGAFIAPIVFRNDAPHKNTICHNLEAFGPISTIMPYKDIDEAAELARMGKGSLCCSIVTANDKIAKEFTLEAAPYHGRILVLNQDCAKSSTGHGSPMPMLMHGGPGHAGGGEEMGGKRGVMHYMQRTAIEGHPTTITEITQQYQQGAKGKDIDEHPFKKYFEEINVGDQLITEKREITANDIDSFAALSGDNFYAHKRETNFTGTMFDGQVAHGYFIMSAAAGLFVDSYEINPVLLNYGIDSLRFTKPVYPGAKLHIRFTCKEKSTTDVTPNDDDPKTKIQRGIVKWMVEMLDDDTEEPLVGIATILTMVKKKNQQVD